MGRVSKWIFGTVCALALAVPAWAGTVTMTFDGLPLSQPIDLIVGSKTVSTHAGILHWTRTGGDHPGLPTGSFATVCVEIDQFLRSTTYDVINVEDGPKPGVALGAGPMGAAKADMLSKLWAAYWNDAQGDADKGAAFQLAVWGVVYSNGAPDLFSGDFRTTYANLAAAPQWVQDAQGLLDSIPGLTQTAPLAILSSMRDQDQLVMVPVAEAVWMGFALLGAVGAYRLRKRREIAA
jgi:hypothetical protein